MTMTGLDRKYRISRDNVITDGDGDFVEYRLVSKVVGKPVVGDVVDGGDDVVGDNEFLESLDDKELESFMDGEVNHAGPVDDDGFGTVCVDDIAEYLD